MSSIFKIHLFEKTNEKATSIKKFLPSKIFSTHPSDKERLDRLVTNKQITAVKPSLGFLAGSITYLIYKAPFLFSYFSTGYIYKAPDSIFIIFIGILIILLAMLPSLGEYLHFEETQPKSITADIIGITNFVKAGGTIFKFIASYLKITFSWGLGFITTFLILDFDFIVGIFSYIPMYLRWYPIFPLESIFTITGTSYYLAIKFVLWQSIVFSVLLFFTNFILTSFILRIYTNSTLIRKLNPNLLPYISMGILFLIVIPAYLGGIYAENFPSSSTLFIFLAIYAIILLVLLEILSRKLFTCLNCHTRIGWKVKFTQKCPNCGHILNAWMYDTY